jgi:hypothetical protein
MAIHELGEIRYEFKPGVENLVAGAIIGLLMIGGGGFLTFLAIQGAIESGGDLPFWVDRGWCWGAVGLMTLIGCGLILGGFFLIRWIRSIRTLHVCVGENGFSVTEKKTTQVFAWPEIASVQETHLYERPPVIKGAAKYLIPKIKSQSYIVKRRDQFEFGFNGNTIKGHLALAEMIKLETNARNVPWNVVEEHA